MATDLGFLPVKQGDYYFISYNSEDTTRVSRITKEMNLRGIPLWYDEGLLAGEKWERQIAEKIKECQAMILFVTKKLMARENPYVQIEYGMASGYKKKVIVILLDSISFGDVTMDLKGWWVRLNKLHCIPTDGIQNTSDIVDIMERHIDFIKIDNTSQASDTAENEKNAIVRPSAYSTESTRTSDSVIIPFIGLDQNESVSSVTKQADSMRNQPGQTESGNPRAIGRTGPVFVDEETALIRSNRPASGKSNNPRARLFVDEQHSSMSNRKGITNYNQTSASRKPSGTPDNQSSRNSVALRGKSTPVIKDHDSSDIISDRPIANEDDNNDFALVIALFILIGIIIFLFLLAN